MRLSDADAVGTFSGIYGCPNVCPTLDISRSMGWNQRLVKRTRGAHFWFHPATKKYVRRAVKKTSVESCNLPQSSAAAGQENQHHKAQSGKRGPIQRHFRSACQHC